MTKQIEILSRDGPTGEYALVSNEDFELVSRFKWYKHGKKGYAIAGISDFSLTGRHSQATMAMHRLIMGCKVDDGKTVDHINHKPLDNRRANLRIVSPGESLRNRRVASTKSAPFKGVRLAASGNWIAYVHLGGFKTPEMAARAYDKAIRKLFPGFPVNFPNEGETGALVA